MIRRALVAAGAVLFAAGPARADNGSLAEALFRDARQAMREGHYADACPKLAESQRLDPSAGTRLNLAVCEEHQGHLATAWAHYRALIDELPATDARAPVARERATALEPRLPWLRIVLPADAGDASVDVDGTALRTASVGAELPVDPGAHVIIVHVGAHARSTTVSLVEGEHRRVSPDATWESRDPLPMPTAPPPASPPPHSRARATAGWITVATGIAGVATSLVFGGLVLDKKAVVQDHCPNKQCDPTGLSAGRAGTTLEEAGTVAFIAGMTGIGVGTFLVAGAPSASVAHARGPFITLQGTF